MVYILQEKQIVKDSCCQRIGGMYKRIVNKAFRKSFEFCQRLGVHIVPNHFYVPIPDTSKLDKRLWSQNSELVGIDINEKKLLDILTHFKTDFYEEYKHFPRHKTDIPHEYYVSNGFFEAVDGEILYCMIRHFKPKKIIEVGSGYSTYLSAQTILKNKKESDHDCELIAIEPYPNHVLLRGFPGLSRLLNKKVQDVPISEFQQLGKNDILFIDSSHVLKIGSDVQYELLDIIPRLKKGVIVCFHDIFMPAEYRKEWIIKYHYFWNEQYLLQAFLAFNESFEVLLASSYLHIKYPHILEKMFPSYNYNRVSHWPASFWIRRSK